MARYRIPGAALAAAREGARRVRALEAAAQAALHDKDDTAAHRAGMTEKCLVLEGLAEEAGGLLPEPTTPDAAAFRAGLEDFGRRAAMALSLESIFFMAALLYPEDYQDGDPNDLERFLDRFEPQEAPRADGPARS